MLVSGRSRIIDRKTIANGLAVRYRVNVTTWLAEGVGSAVARLQVRDAKDGQEREYGDAATSCQNVVGASRRVAA